MPPEASRQIKNIDIVEVDSVAARKRHAGPRHWRPWPGPARSRRFPADRSPLVPRSRATSVTRSHVVGKAAHRVHAAGAQQFAQSVHQSRAADSLGAPRRRSPELKLAVVVDRHFLDGAIQRRHAASDRAAFERRARRTRCGQNPMPVADDQLGIGADIHDGNQALFMRQVHGQHAGGGIGAHVAADDRRAVDARLGMDRQQAAQPASAPGWWWRACLRPFRFR